MTGIHASRVSSLLDGAASITLREAGSAPVVATGFSTPAWVSEFGSEVSPANLAFSQLGEIVVHVAEISITSGTVVLEVYADTDMALGSPVLVGAGISITAAGEYVITLDAHALLAVLAARPSESSLFLAMRAVVSGAARVSYAAFLSRAIAG